MAQMSTPPIVRQPVEMVVKIASDLSIADICALRLTCKVMNELLVEFFFKESFRVKQFWMSDASLQALVAMSAHPSISPELKHVALGSDRLLSGRTRNRVLNPAQMQQREHFLSSQFHMQHSGADVVLLTKAFTNLPNLETVSIRDFDRPSWRGLYDFWDDMELLDSYGTRAVSRATSQRCTVHMARDARGSRNTIGAMFTKALTALANAGARPNAIEAIVRDERWRLGDRAFYIPPNMQPGLVPVLSGLTKLHLDLALAAHIPYDVTEDANWRRHITTNYSPCLQNFLRLLPSLTWLRLSLHSPHLVATQQLLCWLAGGVIQIYKDSARLPEPVKFAHLAHLELADAVISYPALEGLILRYSGTLRKLNLRNVTIDSRELDGDWDGHVWSHFLRFLAAKADLRSFRLSRPEIMPSLPTGPIMPDPEDASSGGGRSRADMKRYLEYLARTMDNTLRETQELVDAYVLDALTGGDDDDDDEDSQEWDYGDEPEDSDGAGSEYDPDTDSEES